ncbi:MAG: hypothetical protein OEV28_06885 [Nitrospirota bacterium]|nr:hypothetical protein [Nitrospirota bacterium]
MKRNYLKAGGLFCVPVLHNSLESAEAVRRVVEEVQPAVIAVELPRSFELVYCEAVARLPFLSVILFENDKGEPLYLPVEPADPIAEAVRIGTERGIPVSFVDIDVGKYPAYREEFPDTYAMHRLGLAAYYRAYEKAVPQPLYSKADRIREQGMAHHLQGLKKQHERVLFVCGMAHLGRVLKDLKKPQALPLAKAKRSKIQLFNLHADSSREVMGVFPFFSALYEELHRPCLKPVIEKVAAPATEKDRGPLRVIDTGKGKMREEHRLMEQINKGAGAVTGHRRKYASVDRQRAMLRLFEAGVQLYERNTGEKVHRWQRQIFFRFARNYALAEDRLVPELYHLLTAARGSVDDNFVYDLWNQATFWPWQDESHKYPTIRISGEDLWLGTRKMRVRRYFPSKRARPVPLKQRKREEHIGEWAKEMLDGDSLCSYQPEDLVIENYGRFLKHKGAKVLEEERCRVEPFTTSMLDGIDVRETLRNWHEKAIYVKSIRPVKGGVGSVVVIFDYDEDNSRYPWQMTWLGEHEQESDMAFYATGMFANVVGPGISRTEYGGFLLSYPPLRLFDIWHDPYYRFIESKAERLLVAGLDYSQERHVVYVAPKPPRSQVVTYAARLNRKIIYIPLRQLSPVMVKKIRVLHVLSSRKVRDVAGEYIW